MRQELLLAIAKSLRYLLSPIVTRALELFALFFLQIFVQLDAPLILTTADRLERDRLLCR